MAVPNAADTVALAHPAALFWFDPYTFEFQGFHLLDGRYEPIPATAEGRLWSQPLGLYLGIWENRLRFFTADGKLIPSPEELASQERHRAEQECQRVEQAE